MEDQEIRVKSLEQSLSKAESRAQAASNSAALLREQLERAHHDKRTLAAEHERAASIKRDLQLQVAELSSSRDADRRKIRDLEASVMSAQSEVSVSKLRIESLENTLSGAEAETQWYRGELDRRSTNIRAQIRDFTTKNAELETLLDQTQAERDALKRQVASLQTSYTTSQEQLESVQAKARTLQKELETSEANMVYGGGSIMLERSIQALQSEIQASHIQEKQLQDRFTEISRAYNDACDRIDEQATQLQAAQDTNSDYIKQVAALKEENHANKNALSRLGRQIHHLLINAQLAADSEPLLTSDEKIELSKALSISPSSGSAMEVVVDRLGYFKDIGELIHQNEMQLRVLDSLTAKCEKYEEQESIENTAVTEAKETIMALNARIKELQTERDVIRSVQPTLTEPPIISDTTGAEDRVSVLQTDLDLAKNMASSLQAQLSSVLQSSANATQRAAILAQDLADTREVAEQLRVEKSRLESRSRLLESQFESQQYEVTQLHAQRNALNADYASLREQLSEKDHTLVSTQTSLLEQIDTLRAEVTSVRHELTESESQLKLYASQRGLAAKQAETLKNELLHSKLAYESLEQKYALLEKELAASEERLKLRTISFTTADSETANQLEDKLKQAEAQIQDLRMLASDTQKELDANKKSFEAQKEELDRQVAAAKASLDSVSNELNVLKNTPPDTTALDAATKELTEVNQILEKVRQESDAAIKAAESKFKSDSEALMTRLSESETKLESFALKVALLESQKQELENTIESIKLSSNQEVEKLTKQCEALDTAVNTLRSENADLLSNKELLLEQLQASMKPEGDDLETLVTDMSSSEELSPLVDMLKRDKQVATVLLENSNAKVRELENQVLTLQGSLEKAEKEVTQLAQSNSDNSAPYATVKLEESNDQLLTQLKEVTEQRDQLQTQLTDLQNSCQNYQDKIRSVECAAATARQELELIKSDRDLWKKRVSSTDNEKAAAIQAQLEEKDAELVTLKQEYETKLEQESQRLKSATNQLKQLNAKVQELSTPSEKDTVEVAKKNERISYLENEINRISDELTEEEQKKKELSAEVASLTMKLSQVESSLASAEQKATEAQAAQQAAQQALASNSAVAERVQKLEEELANANSKIEANENAAIELDIGGEPTLPAPEDIQKLKDSLAAKSSQEEIGELTQLVEKSTKDRLKSKFTEHLQKHSTKLEAVTKAKELLEKEREALLQERDTLANQLKEVKETVSTIEVKEAERYALKAKLVQKKLDNLQANNELLTKRLRLLKGGSDNNDEIKTLPDGTTKVVPAGQPVAQQPVAVSQRPQQKRPQVQRNGTKQNKRNISNNTPSDGNDINKRLRES